MVKARAFGSQDWSWPVPLNFCPPCFGVVPLGWAWPAMASQVLLMFFAAIFCLDFCAVILFSISIARVRGGVGVEDERRQGRGRVCVGGEGVIVRDQWRSNVAKL